MKNYSPQTLDKKERSLKENFKPIKILKRKQFANIQKLIKYVILERPKTIYVKSKKIHCNNDKNRSIIDIYSLILYYFPNTKLTYKELYNSIKKNHIYRSIVIYCCVINRYVFMRTSSYYLNRNTLKLENNK